MDFREVWTRTNTMEHKQDDNHSIWYWNLILAIICLAASLLLLNLVIIIFFYRKTIFEKVRASVYRLTHNDRVTVSYHHVYDDVVQIHIP